MPVSFVGRRVFYNNAQWCPETLVVERAVAIAVAPGLCAACGKKGSPKCECGICYCSDTCEKADYFHRTIHKETEQSVPNTIESELATRVCAAAMEDPSLRGFLEDLPDTTAGGPCENMAPSTVPNTLFAHLARRVLAFAYKNVSAISGEVLSCGFWKASALARRSCTPNVHVCIVGDTLRVFTRFALSEGEELTIPHDEAIIDFLPDARRRQIVESWGFEYLCSDMDDVIRPANTLPAPLAEEYQSLRSLFGDTLAERSARADAGMATKGLDLVTHFVEICAGAEDEAIFRNSGFLTFAIVALKYSLRMIPVVRKKERARIAGNAAQIADLCESVMSTIGAALRKSRYAAAVFHRWEAHFVLCCYYLKRVLTCTPDVAIDRVAEMASYVAESVENLKIEYNDPFFAACFSDFVIKT